MEEYRRFEERVEHAEDMAYEYLDVQQRLTQGIIGDPAMRRTHRDRDTMEQIRVQEWINQANDVLDRATLIKIKLDNMNILITKLELSAAFASVYEGFMEIPLSMRLLNQELDTFEEKSELIYQTFGPEAQR